MMRAIFLLLLLPVILIVTFFLVTTNPHLAAGSDFVSYYAGASIIKDGKADLIYDATTQSKYFDDIIYPLSGTITNRFVSLPFVSFLFFPFTFFNFFVAYKLFFLFNLGLFAILLFFLAREFEVRKKLEYFILIAFFYFFPVFVTLFMGQTSFILAIIFLLIYRSLKSNNFKAAGILSALLLIKPQYFLAVPFIFLLVKRKKEFIYRFFGVSLAIFLSSLAIVGPQALRGYFTFVKATEIPDFGNRAYQLFSFQGAISHLFFNSNLTHPVTIIINFLLYFLSILLFYKATKKYSFNKKFVVIILLTLVFGVHVLGHDLILLIIPIFILLQSIYKIGLESRSLLLVSTLLFLLPATLVFGYSSVGAIVMFLLVFTVLLKKEYLGI